MAVVIVAVEMSKSSAVWRLKYLLNLNRSPVRLDGNRCIQSMQVFRIPSWFLVLINTSQTGLETIVTSTNSFIGMVWSTSFSSCGNQLIQIQIALKYYGFLLGARAFCISSLSLAQNDIFGSFRVLQPRWNMAFVGELLA